MSPPAQLTSFVGRERELREVHSLLERRRLVTLAGAGGTGKTRLALELTNQRDFASALEDSVVFVDLAPLGDPTQVPTALVDALGLREQADRTPDSVLIDYLESREVLLLVDNCEHVLQAIAACIARILQAAPRLRVLATSRQPLGIAGEAVWRVPPLDVPAPNLTTRDEIVGSDAVRLFVDRAQLTRPDFALTDSNAAAVCDICFRLDGLPLAIELAAALLPILSVHELAERLDDRFRLLTRGGSTALPRQRTLRAVVDWSHDRLDAPERWLLRRLSVFAGGWTLAAAEAVGTVDDAPDLDVLASLSRLVDASLVVAEEQRQEMRYRLLETIREFAAHQLRESGEEASTRERHAAWCLGLAMQFDEVWRGPQQLEWLERMDVEYPNLRAALAWCEEQSNPRLGLSLAAALWHFWEVRGHLSEGRAWCTRMLALVNDDTEPAADRAWALNVAGHLALMSNDLKPALRLLEESLTCWQAIGDRRGLGYATFSHGLVWQAGLPELGERSLRQSLALGQAIGDRVLQYVSLYNLGDAAMLRRDLDEAELLHEASLALKREQGDAWSLANSLTSLAELKQKRGDLEAAVRLFVEATDCHRRVGDRRLLVVDVEGLACVAAAQGEAVRTARLLGGVKGPREAFGMRRRWPTVEAAEQLVVQSRPDVAFESATFATAWAEARNWSLDETVAYALGERAEPAVRAPRGVLTPRELEVARLVAAGMSNRQIAQTLVVTQWTAEKHVQHILDKLGLSSRAQVAVWAVERGLRVSQVLS